MVDEFHWWRSKLRHCRHVKISQFQFWLKFILIQSQMAWMELNRCIFFFTAVACLHLQRGLQWVSVNAECEVTQHEQSKQEQV